MFFFLFFLRAKVKDGAFMFMCASSYRGRCKSGHRSNCDVSFVCSSCVRSLLLLGHMASALLLPWAVTPVAVHSASNYQPQPKTKTSWTKEEGGRGGGGDKGKAKTGRDQRREKTKNVATGSWVTLRSVQEVVLLTAETWSQTHNLSCRSDTCSLYTKY